jgi:CBS domain-containing protein
MISRKRVVRVIKIEDWMTKRVLTLKKTDTVYKAVKMMDSHNIGVIPVDDNGRPIGIITERDIIRRAVAAELPLKTTKVEQIMTKNPVTVNSTSSILEVAKLMSKNNFRRVIVVKKGKIAGIITAKDIINLMSV